MANIVQVLIQIQNNIDVDNSVVVLIQNILQVNVVQVLVAIQNSIQFNNQVVGQIQSNVQITRNSITQVQTNINVLSVTIEKRLDDVCDKLYFLHKTWPWLPKEDQKDYMCPTEKK